MEREGQKEKAISVQGCKSDSAGKKKYFSCKHVHVCYFWFEKSNFVPFY